MKPWRLVYIIKKNNNNNNYTVEPLYCRHHWEPSNCPDCRGVFNSRVVLYRITTTGTIVSVHCPYFRAVHSERFHCIMYIPKAHAMDLQ